MKIKKNQVVRIGAGANIPVRYWGRLGRVCRKSMTRKSDGKFAGSVVVVAPHNKRGTLAVTKNKLLAR